MKKPLQWFDFVFPILALVMVVVLWVMNFRLLSACVFVVAGFSLLVYLAFGAMALYPNPLSNFLAFLRVSVWQLYVVVILAVLMFGLAKASLEPANQSDEDAE